MPIDDDLKEVVNKAAEKSLRMVKVVVEGKPPRLTLGDTVVAGEAFDKDFEAMKEGPILEAAVPCILLVRIADEKGTVEGAQATDWLLLSWTPDDAPVRQKMLYTSSCKTLKDCFESLNWKEMKATDKDEVALKEVLAQTRRLRRQMTKEERHEVMTGMEIQQEEAREGQLEEQKAAPKRLAGLVALQIKPLESFEEATRQLLEGSDKSGKAILAKLTGPKREELSAEVLDDVDAVSKLKGRLPDEACYFILRPAEKRLLLITWLPEGCPARLKMPVSTFKKSVIEILEGKLPGAKIARAEISEEADLEDTLADEQPEESTTPAAGADGGAAASPKKAFKPPVGGFALPGLGPPR